MPRLENALFSSKIFYISATINLVLHVLREAATF